MSTLSWPTSSSSAPLSPPLARLSSSSSSSSSLFSVSSTTDSLSVGVADVPHQLEVVRGDDRPTLLTGRALMEIT